MLYLWFCTPFGLIALIIIGVIADRIEHWKWKRDSRVP